MPLTYGSICTGYDGIGMGLALAGQVLDRQWSAENEASVAEVLKLEHPDVVNFGDIKAVDWGDVAPVTLMSSGDPCQPISIAGWQAGRDDPRFLWPWVRDAYRAAEPDRIFFENVANMVSHDGGRTMAERFEHLREDGYAVKWAVIGACAVGAPHHRHRWFALAEFVGGDVPEAVRVGGKTAICGAPRNRGRQYVPTPITTDGHGPGNTDGRSMDLRTVACWVLPTPNARDGGQRGTPSPEHAARRAADPMRSLNLEDATVLLPAPRATDGTNGGPNQRGSSGDLAMGSACQLEVWGKYADAVALWEGITGNPAPEPTEQGPKGGRRLNPALSEWMMGLRPGLLTERMSRNDALKAAGNGCVPLQVAAAWRMLTES